MRAFDQTVTFSVTLITATQILGCLSFLWNQWNQILGWQVPERGHY